MNPICETMNWPVPAADECLIIMADGRRHAVLTSSHPGAYEGVYLLNAGFGVPNACLSIIGKRSPAAIRSQLAQKLFANARPLKNGDVAALTAKLEAVTVQIEKTSRDAA